MKDIHIFRGYDEARRAVQGVPQKAKTNWQQYVQTVRSHPNLQPIQRMDPYLEHFCEVNQGSLQEFSKWFVESHLEPIEKKWKCLCARDGMTSLD